MSASSQRMRKSSPCSTGKQGPMRATLPVSSLLRQSRQQPSGNGTAAAAAAAAASTAAAPGGAGASNSGSAAAGGGSRKSNSSSPTVSPTNALALAASAGPTGVVVVAGGGLVVPCSSSSGTVAAAAERASSNASAGSSSGGSAWRNRISPEAAASGQRSPGSLSCKGYFAKSKTLSARCSDSLGASQSIRRTASLDTIYLKGQWPRDSHYVHHSTLLVDKATQTDDWSNEFKKPHSRHATTEQSTPDDKLEKYFRHRLQRTNKEGTSSRERTAAFGLIMPGGPPPALPGDHSVLLPSIASQTSAYNQFSLSTKASPMNIPVKPMRPPMRSSIEGLNQEIEGLVLKSNNNSNDPDHQVEDKYARYRDQMTPEGHRAPLADLFKANRSVNSVNTQTPATDLPSSSYSSGPPSRNSESPLIPGSLDVSRPSSDLLQGGSRGSTPDQEREGRLGTSPHINRFLAREPPDGCEKVNTKFVEEVRRPMADLSKLDYSSKPCVSFQLKPSLGSAFLPLQQVSPTMVTSSTSPSLHTAPTTPPPNP